jgi:3'-phosphoadenosine 5'-phosphosulfate sulfotransferase (PAPS reductase)/FAD synthetase
VSDYTRPPLVVSCSGGKDSTAVVLHLREIGLAPTHAVFMDTGWEERRTLDYVRDTLPGVLGMPVTWLRASVPLPADPALAAVVEECEALLGWESPMVRLIVRKGMFPVRQMKWCTEVLKTTPFFDWMLATFPARMPTAFATGIRAEESASRSTMPEFSPLFRTEGSVPVKWRPLVPAVLQWRPLIQWTFDDVIAIHKRHGIAPNPLYLEGASRVGCWPCIHAHKQEIRRIADTSPERIRVIRILEATATRVATARVEARGETLRGAPAFFQSRTGQTPEGKHDGRCIPIDEAIEWSRTGRGGRQFELFAPDDREAGCMRWGMCETARETETVA